MRVLVTGAAGSLGRTVTVGLADRGHEVVGLDLLPEPEGFEGGWHAVDCADADAVAAVFTAQPLDAVVHLAGNPDESSLPEALTWLENNADPQRPVRRKPSRGGRS